MNTVVGVRFRNAGKIYFFAPGSFELSKGMHVIVETARGIEYGTCVNDPYEVEDDKIVAPLKPILRVATERDDKQSLDNRVREREAFKICQERIRDHGLEMKLIDTEYTFDNSKVLFYFTADGRVDFRDLVKDLAGIFRTRIELRQVGVRDETKILGGIGICGRPLCCHSYLSDFVPVSIKMAKEQNLSLNPTKISGVCGRLMCCLANEEEVYEEQNRKLPSPGDYVTTVAGERGIVQNVDIFREIVRVLVQSGDDKELKEYGADDIRFKKRRKRGKLELTPEEMEQLRALEPEDVAALEADTDSDTEDLMSFSVRDRLKKNNESEQGGRFREGREKNRGRGRDRDQNREGGRNKDRDRNRDRDQNREGGRNKDRDRNRDGERSRDRDQNRENRDGERSRDRYQNRENRDQNREGARGRDASQDRDANVNASGEGREDDQNRERRNNRFGNRNRRRGGRGRRDGEGAPIPGDANAQVGQGGSDA